jgi:hypothetical protein
MFDNVGAGFVAGELDVKNVVVIETGFLGRQGDKVADWLDLVVAAGYGEGVWLAHACVMRDA